MRIVILLRCCVLVGQMQTALLEIRGMLSSIDQLCVYLTPLEDNFRPDRIIIECSYVPPPLSKAHLLTDTSGSAFPATLAFQIRQLEKDTNGDFALDAIVTVVDAENFAGYEDDSPTARMQASYSDIILINKWEHVSERDLDIVMDHLYTLNDETPKIKCHPQTGIDPDLIFGLQSKLFLKHDNDMEHVHDEVETITISPPETLEKCVLIDALALLSRDAIWRVKGFVGLSDERRYILNWAFGRYELTAYEGSSEGITVMGRRGEVRSASAKFVAALSHR